MDRWKSRGAKSQRREEKRREEERRSEKRKRHKTEDAGAQKGSKVAKRCVFPMVCDSGGSKSRLAKAAGAEPSGQMRDCAKHKCPRQSKCTKHTKVGALLDVEMWKSARHCCAKHISKSKCTKHLCVGLLLEVDMSKKCAPLWREARFEVKSVKNWRILDVHMSFRVAGARDCAPCQKWAKRGVLSGVGHLKRICIDVFSVGGAVQETLFIRDVRRSGRWFSETGCILSIRSSGLVRWFCVIGAALRMTWPRFLVAGAVL